MTTTVDRRELTQEEKEKLLAKDALTIDETMAVLGIARRTVFKYMNATWPNAKPGEAPQPLLRRKFMVAGNRTLIPTTDIRRLLEVQDQRIWDMERVPIAN
jgi:predicted DNA-binding transcriptional regulator AlpA